MSLRRSSRPELIDLQTQVVTRDIGNLSASRWKKDDLLSFESGFAPAGAFGARPSPPHFFCLEVAWISERV